MTLDPPTFNARADAVALVFHGDRVSLLRQGRAGWTPLATAQTDAPNFKAVMRDEVARARRMLAGGPLIVTLPTEHVLRRRIEARSAKAARAAAFRMLRAEFGARAASLIVAVEADDAGVYAVAAADKETVAEACAHARRWGAGAVCVAGPAPLSQQTQATPTPAGPFLADPADRAPTKPTLSTAWRGRAAIGAGVALAAFVALWFSTAHQGGWNTVADPRAPSALSAPTPPMPMQAEGQMRSAAAAPSSDLAVAGFTPGRLNWLATPAGVAGVDTAPAALPQRAAAPAPAATALRLRTAVETGARPAQHEPPDWGAATLRSPVSSQEPWITAQAVPDAVTRPHVPESRPDPAEVVTPPFVPIPRAGAQPVRETPQASAEDAAPDAPAADRTETSNDVGGEPEADIATAQAAAGGAEAAPFTPQPRPDAVAARVEAVTQAGPAFSARPTRRPAVRPAAGVRQAASGRGDAARRATFRTAIVVEGPRLLGVTGGPNTQRALFQASNGAIRRLAKGQTVDGWTVADIDGDRVRMRSPQGAQVLSVPGR